MGGIRLWGLGGAGAGMVAGIMAVGIGEAGTAEGLADSHMAAGLLHAAMVAGLAAAMVAGLAAAAMVAGTVDFVGRDLHNEAGFNNITT